MVSDRAFLFCLGDFSGSLLLLLHVALVSCLPGDSSTSMTSLGGATPYFVKRLDMLEGLSGHQHSLNYTSVAFGKFRPLEDGAAGGYSHFKCLPWLQFHLVDVRHLQKNEYKKIVVKHRDAKMCMNGGGVVSAKDLYFIK